MSEAIRIGCLALCLTLLLGCRSVHYEGTTLLPPVTARSTPNFAEVRRCLFKVFSRHMPATVMKELHTALRESGEAWFQVPVESTSGTYYHHHYIAYLSGPQVLVVGRINKDESIDQLGAWYVDQPEALPSPAQVEPPSAVPSECPKCSFKKLLPSYKNCPGCNHSLQR